MSVRKHEFRKIFEIVPPSLEGHRNKKLSQEIIVDYFETSSDLRGRVAARRGGPFILFVTSHLTSPARKNNVGVIKLTR